MSGRDTPLERMPVVILAGGKGTRLREETERVPKPLVGIGERPILWHIMKLFGHHGANRFVLCLGFKSWLIKEYFLRYREQIADVTVRLGDPAPPVIHGNGDEDWEVTLAETGLETGTGARLHRVREYVDTDTFILTYGDGLGSVDIGALVDFHRSHGRIGTVTGVHPTSRYGEMKVTDGVVTDFVEKPTTAEGFVSGGFFVFQREFLDYLDDDPELMFERAPLQRLARDGELAVFPHSGFWMGMDTFREFSELNRLWAQGDAPWKVWEPRARPRAGPRPARPPRTRRAPPPAPRSWPPQRVEVDEHEPLDARLGRDPSRVAAGGVDRRSTPASRRAPTPRASARASRPRTARCRRRRACRCSRSAGRRSAAPASACCDRAAGVCAA